MSIFDNIGAKVKIVKIKANDIKDIIPQDCNPGDIMLLNQELIRSILLKYAELDMVIRITADHYIRTSDFAMSLYVPYNESLMQIALIKTFIVTFVRNYETYIDHGYTSEDMSKVISNTPPDIKAFEYCDARGSLNNINNIKSPCDECIFCKTNNITKLNMLNICLKLSCPTRSSNNKSCYFKLV